MRKVFKYAMLFAAAGTLTASLSSCGEDSGDTPTPTDPYADKSYGQAAIDACDELSSALTAAFNAINNSQLSEAQTVELSHVIDGAVNNTIVPTYTLLGNAVEKLQTALGNLSENEITQANINSACEAFKEARAYWEKSEAFLGGAASDFNIDPHIDSWPLNRTLLHSYFETGSFSAEAIEDASILGFHALEFILFRDGQPRKLAEFKGYDTYKGFTDVKGAEELKYAKSVIADLLVHVYELQVAWQDVPDAKRLAAVKQGGLDYLTSLGTSYGYNMKNYGTAKSTFRTIEEAIQQLLSLTEGSCVGISDEVGSTKIANPFTKGDISYVESPYSYNSIPDFQNNIRSIENIWYGGMEGSSTNAEYSFHKFFAANNSAVGKRVETAIANAISKIGNMPAPFVKYVSVVWNKDFVDAPILEQEE